MPHDGAMPPEAMAGMDASMMEAMPPEAMAGMDAPMMDDAFSCYGRHGCAHDGGLPPEAMAGWCTDDADDAA